MSVDGILIAIFSFMPYVLCILCIIHIVYLLSNARSVNYNHNVGYAQLLICIGYLIVIHSRVSSGLMTMLYESVYFSTLVALNSEFFIEQFNEAKRKITSFAEFSKCETVTQEEREFIATQFIRQNPNADLLNLSIRRIVNTVRMLSWCIMMICLLLILIMGK